MKTANSVSVLIDQAQAGEWNYALTANQMDAGGEDMRTVADEASISSTEDSTPPSVTPVVSGTMGGDGWYTSDITVSWIANDPESGIASYDGCAPTTINAPTTGTTITCSATSEVGLSSSGSVTIKRHSTIDLPSRAGWNMVGGSPLTVWGDASASWTYSAASGSWSEPTGLEDTGGGAWEEAPTDASRPVAVETCAGPLALGAAAHRWNMVADPCDQPVSLPPNARALWWDSSLDRYSVVMAIPAGAAAWIMPATDSVVLTPS